MRTLLRLPGRTQGTIVALALLVGGTWVVRGADTDADLQLQLATLLYDETRYQEALQAFDQASQTDDPRIAVRARKGTVRSSLKVAEFGRARSNSATRSAEWTTPERAARSSSGPAVRRLRLKASSASP